MSVCLRFQVMDIYYGDFASTNFYGAKNWTVLATSCSVMILGFYFTCSYFRGRVSVGKVLKISFAPARAKKNAPTRQRFMPFRTQQGNKVLYDILNRTSDSQSPALSLHMAHTENCGWFQRGESVVLTAGVFHFFIRVLRSKIL